ncbi:MAG: hypothetical protein R3B91_07465 [Planctomycetaceae bacterium]
MLRTTSLVLTIATASIVLSFVSAPRDVWADAMDRLKIPELKKLRAAIEVLREDYEPVTLESGSHFDYRAILHAHSH